MRFLRASWSQFGEVKCGSYSRAQMSSYQVALTTSEITDVVCACVYKEIFFTEKNMKKITEKYNSYQRNARLIHILPVSAKLVYTFVQIALKKKKAVQSTDTQTHRRIGWKMIL